ncbi:alpha-farnesene synthase-like [Silene latifolia]|uniref:alpha-farnesene synthase-like n=1 Tax=Silene latifolia TaxID=37657 RepID=UPI003D773600
MRSNNLEVTEILIQFPEMDVFGRKGCGGRTDIISGELSYSIRTNQSNGNYIGTYLLHPCLPLRSISFPSLSLPVPSLKTLYQKTPLVQQSSLIMATKAYNVTHQRRSANYKPNIWSYDFVQSLQSQFIDVAYKIRSEKLKEEFMHSLSEETELSKLHIVDSISKLGLSSLFTKYTKDVLDFIASNTNMTSVSKEDILKTALSFRLLRQHGYNVSQDVFVDFIDEMHPCEEEVGSDHIRGVLELFEASHLAIEGDEILMKAMHFSYHNLESHQYFDNDTLLSQQVTHALKGPCHWRVVWFDVIHQIHACEQANSGTNKILVELAKLNFNITQAMLIEELKELSRWWNDLGLIKSINFSRDRLVESFLWTVGIAFEPQYALLRKCLTKVITFILVIDDLYDIYGSLEELKSFTKAVERWDSEELQQLPECIKICFEALRTTTAEIADEIQKENDCGDISFYLITAWADFCKALLSEALWYNTNYIPSVEEYMEYARITSSGPLLSLVTCLCTTDCKSDLLKDKLREDQDLVYNMSVIVRLSNDLGTSAAELERGDSPSSILCYMVEAKATEEMARLHVKKMISDTWKNINEELLSASSNQQSYVNLVINIARVFQFVYREGDGFSVPDKDTRKQIKSILIEPLQLSMN